MERCDKNTLMRIIQMYTFALIETNLYLDAYPCCTQALECFRKFSKALGDATDIYESRFGPITSASAACGERFTWTDAPWPWECA